MIRTINYQVERTVLRNIIQKLGPVDAVQRVVQLVETDCEMNESFVFIQRSSECSRSLAISDAVAEVQSLEMLITSQCIPEGDKRTQLSQMDDYQSKVL
jgi:hypothetical protein